MQKKFLSPAAEEEEIDQKEKKQGAHNCFPIRDRMNEVKNWLEKIR
jgi:hypothetical protein